MIFVQFSGLFKIKKKNDGLVTFTSSSSTYKKSDFHFCFLTLCKVVVVIEQKSSIPLCVSTPKSCKKACITFTVSVYLSVCNNFRSVE
jgi:hypothetical protein